MAGETPDIRVIIGTSGDAISTDSAQGPLQVSEPLIIKPSTTDGVTAIPVNGDSNPLEHLAVLRGSDSPLIKFRAVTQLTNGKVVHMDPTSEAHKKGYLGITQNNASVGKKATVVTQGLMNYSGWTWTQGPVHSDADGVLTQNITASTFQVATAITPTQLKIGISTAASATTATTFLYTAPSALMVWEIQHNMGRFPVVSVVDSDNNVIFADVAYVDINTVHVNFAYPTGGSAYLV
jgi:hypothetical protein